MTLANSDVMAFVATTQPEAARAFYCDVLGLSFEEDSPFALVVKTANATLRIQKVQTFEPLPFTSLGWTVTDIKATVQQLARRACGSNIFRACLRTISASGPPPAALKCAGSKTRMGMYYH